MPEIIKTIESWRDPERVRANLSRYGEIGQREAPELVGYYAFQLGRGKPKRQPVTRLWFAYQGKLYGSFKVDRIEQNAGQWEEHLKEFMEAGYSFRHDNWLAVCVPPFEFFGEGVSRRPDGAHGKGREAAPEAATQDIYYTGFQGWRYFDLESYRRMPEANFSL